jgi:betaine-aldehyde dehydrogenase
MAADKAYAVPVRHPDRLYIGGEWVTPGGGDLIDVVQPATEDVWVRVAAARKQDVSRAVAAARQAFDRGPWPRMTHAERAQYLRAIATGLRERADDLSYIWSSEMGILHVDAVTRGARIPGIYDFYAGLADSFEFVERHEPAGGGYGWLVREPVGCGRGDHPVERGDRGHELEDRAGLAGGLHGRAEVRAGGAGGCLPARGSGGAAGLPPGVLNIITAEREVSEELVRDPGIDKISFTGSTAAGRRIAGICAERVARVNLELGGKSAALNPGWTTTSRPPRRPWPGRPPSSPGQVCSALTRVIVSKHRHDELVEALSAEFAKVRVGDRSTRTSTWGQWP